MKPTGTRLFAISTIGSKLNVVNSRGTPSTSTSCTSAIYATSLVSGLFIRDSIIASSCNSYNKLMIDDDFPLCRRRGLKFHEFETRGPVQIYGTLCMS